MALILAAMPKSKQPTAYPLRMPDEIREALTERARANGRSLNAEILTVLELSLTKDQMGRMSADELIEELVRRFGAQFQIAMEPGATYGKKSKKK